MPWALIVALLAAPTRAQAPDPAGAEALFRQGIERKKAGDLAGACAAFEESARLETAGGTLFALGDCLEQQGKLATAWARFHEALEIARKRGNSAKERETAARIAAIEPRLARVTVQVAPRTASLAGLRVSRDGGLLGSASWGLPLPTDPGSHTYEATAPGKRPWSQAVEIPSAAASITVAVPELPDTPAAASAPPPASSTPPPSPASTPAAPAPAPPGTPTAERSSRTMIRPAGFALLGVGAASLLVAGAFKLRSNAKIDEATPHCPDGCDDRGHQLYQEAISAHKLAVGWAIAGGALAVSGAVLLLLAPPSKPSTAAWLGVSPSGVALGGRW